MSSSIKGGLAVALVAVAVGTLVGCGDDDESGGYAGGSAATSGKGGSGKSGGGAGGAGGSHAGNGSGGTKSSAGHSGGGSVGISGDAGEQNAPGGAGAGGAESGGAAAGGMESGGGGAGAGTSGASGDAGGAGAPAEADVVACEASVDAVHAACDAEQPGAPRLCVYDAYRPFCKTGRTAVVKAIFDCLKLDACQTPGDPSNAGDCMSNVVHTQATAADHGVAAAVCTCGLNGSVDCSTDELSAIGPDVMMLDESDENAFTTCLSTACDIDGCWNASPLGPANACPGL